MGVGTRIRLLMEGRSSWSGRSRARETGLTSRLAGADGCAPLWGSQGARGVRLGTLETPLGPPEGPFPGGKSQEWVLWATQHLRIAILRHHGTCPSQSPFEAHDHPLVDGVPCLGCRLLGASIGAIHPRRPVGAHGAHSASTACPPAGVVSGGWPRARGCSSGCGLGARGERPAARECGRGVGSLFSRKRVSASHRTGVEGSKFPCSSCARTHTSSAGCSQGSIGGPATRFTDGLRR